MRLRASLALAALVGASFLGGAVPAHATEPGCPKKLLELLGYCPTTSTDGSGVESTGTRTIDGTDGTSDNTGGTDGTTDPLAHCVAILNGRCMDTPFVVTDTSTPRITITDLAVFTPDPTALATEPAGAGIADMPTNFLASATTHTRTGELFGIPLTVRFTPVAYDYTYGDGTTATLTTPGRTWADLGQAQFTPTPTSHVYTDRGTYTAQVDIRYTAEIDFGTGWYPIAGELTTTGPTQQIQIFEAHTALVAHTCAETPTAPGC